jgi:hypothetical protein
MSNTPNLNISHIASSQNQKEVTANTAFDDLDTAMTDTLTVDLSTASGGAITPTTSTVLLAFALKFTNQASPDADITVNVPSNKHFYRLHHAGSGSHNVIVKVSGQTGVTLAPGNVRLVYCNGTDVVVAENVYELLANKDTDGTLTANSDTKYASQKATKTYVDAAVAGAGAIKTVTVDISSSDLINAGTTPIVLVAAPGANKMLIVVSASLLYKYNSVAYNSNAGVRLEYDNLGPFGSTLVLPNDFFETVGGNNIGVFTLPFGEVSVASLGSTNLPLTLVANVACGPILSASLDVGGSGYAPGDTGTITSGGADATYVVDTVDGGGAVLTFHLSGNGSHYEVSTGNATSVDTGGGDGGFTIDIGSVTLGNGTARATICYYTIATT